ncbi:hypothetical protein CHLRE_14g628450v5 [Chlamydomonas reinhardtii]|uniref:PPIase cyclophilin-type domain-containing protein n=1 Tax=Chlamydomonas reinhardtii TaxID=3055 RepID=A8IV02_CHLRE|nr:uncharacterized protein CHLRE_14g628450v5 [Chlamydomonas reinhardtii]PNW73340.1 hypothetical protein CHLRE_14g628450v5 [Chlamydomonas reinhardtii]|eukprot:XP_001692793.1 peptidyl-prolyl cis-transisomerase, cyclophilin type [Chlamydomonas reinhardtii]
MRLLVTIVLVLALVGCSLHAAEGAGRNGAFIGYHESEARREVTLAAQPKPGPFRVKISSSYGEFIIKLRPDLAPDTCTLVWELAQKGNCPSCKFYRHEPVPMEWGNNGFFGPPYALLQGSLADLARQPPFENKGTTVQKGHICMIPNCKEFFIATADHSEWGQSHTVWGEVEDLSAEPNYPFEPFHSNTHDNITTRWLDNTYAFNLTAIEPVPLGTGSSGSGTGASL